MQTSAPFNPFPGLRPFEPDEDHLFFGREREIDELLRRFRSSRFLAVVGSSGSGKSSLVRSGLIPTLQGGFMVGAGSSWRVAVARPGADPINNLSASLSAKDVLGSSEDDEDTGRILLDVTLRRSSLGLVEAYRQAQISRQENLLVVVDQFEELFRYRHSCSNDDSGDDAVAFAKLLLEATRQDELPIYVVLTMRSDFIGDCTEYPGLPEAMNAGLYLVPRMTRDELRLAITGPIAVGGGQIATRLVLRMLNDLSDHDQLPVLQHALMRTWDHWQQRGQPSEPMDVPDYEAIGALEQALSIHAEEAYQETGSDTNRQTTARMFKTLTDTFSDPRGVRRPTSVRQLARICEVDEQDVIEIVEVFRQRGRSFLTPPCGVPIESGSVIDISHESLMRCWTRLIKWAEQEKASAEFYIRLSKATEWYAEGTGGLWRDPELEFGLRWWVENRPTAAWGERYDASFMQMVEFLDRSKKDRDRLATAEEKARKKKLRQTQLAAVVLGTLLAVTGFLAYVARKENARAESNLMEARTAVDEMLSAAGRRSARVGADVPEMEAFRQELLEKARTFYLGFARQEPGNEGLRAGMAQAHSRVGDIDRLMDNRSDAANEYKDAITQFAGLAKDYPNKPEYREALGYGYNFLGETLRPQQHTAAETETAYNDALKIQQNLVRENPRNVRFQQELARTYYNRGILLHDTHPTDAEKDFREAIQLLAPLAAAATDPSASQELARAYNNLGNLLRENNQRSEATEGFQKAIAIVEGLTEKVPNEREYKLELAEYYDNFAMLLLDENRVEMANENNLKTLALIEQLAAPAPSLSIELANIHNIRAQILEGQDRKEAQANCQQSMEILTRLEERQDFRNLPDLQRVFRDLGYNYAELADRGLKSGSFADAQAALNNLSRLLPDVSEQDRVNLNKYYQQLRGRMAKPN